MSETILSVKDLKVYFPIVGDSGGWRQKKVDLKAVDGVSFDLKAVKRLGLWANLVVANQPLAARFSSLSSQRMAMWCGLAMT